MMSLCWYMYITFTAALTFVTSTMYLEVAHNGKAIPLLQNGDVAENVLEGNLNPREATVPVLRWACAACAPNSVVLCQDGTGCFFYVLGVKGSKKLYSCVCSN